MIFFASFSNFTVECSILNFTMKNWTGNFFKVKNDFNFYGFKRQFEHRKLVLQHKSQSLVFMYAAVHEQWFSLTRIDNSQKYVFDSLIRLSYRRSYY